MMSSLSMGDFVSPSGSSLSPLDGSALRVSHEHTDSGLGADQDYAYSSERFVSHYFIKINHIVITINCLLCICI